MKTTLITGQLKHIVRTKRTREKKTFKAAAFPCKYIWLGDFSFETIFSSCERH